MLSGIKLLFNRTRIAVGTIFHLDIIKQCASSKGRIRAIYCEKPISTTVEEVEEAFRVATEAGILLHACWNRRQDPFIQSACQKVGKGLSASFIFGDNPVPPQEVYCV
jgi:myo-inositol 2-dehydrogenase/D-chiro-inositol 1-dehydrogenase